MCRAPGARSPTGKVVPRSSGDELGGSGGLLPAKAGPQIIPNPGAGSQAGITRLTRANTQSRCGLTASVPGARDQVAHRARCASPRRPATGRHAAARGASAGIVAERAAQAQVRGRERVPLAARPHRDVLRGPGPKPGSACELARRCRRGRATRSSATVAGRDRAGERVDGPGSCPVSPSRRGRRRRASPRSGKRWVSPSGRCPGPRSRSARRAGPASVVAPRHRDLLAEDRADADLERVDRAGHAQPAGAPRTSGRSVGSRARCGVDRRRVGVEVEQPADAARRGARARRRRGGARAAAARRRSGSSPHLDHARARRRARRCGGRRRASRSTRLDARDRARREEREHRVPRERRAVRHAQLEAAVGDEAVGQRGRRARSSCGVNRNTSFITRFICRTLLNPAAVATLRHREVGVVEQAPREVRAGATARPRPASRRRAVEQAAEVARAHAEPRARASSSVAPSSAPSAMQRSARHTSSGASTQPGSGSRSGRHRRQGRKPAASAAAADVYGRVLRRSGWPLHPAGSRCRW